MEGCYLKKKISRGLKTAVFKSDCTTPEAREVLMMFVIVGRRTSRVSYSGLVGMGSRSLDFGAFFRRISKTNCSVVGVCQNRGFDPYRLLD